jgi:hypothetical protein
MLLLLCYPWRTKEKRFDGKEEDFLHGGFQEKGNFFSSN